MSQSIEIELKNLLTQQEFMKLKSFFQFKEDDFFSQENHYFDTKDFLLKKAGCALRIRKKNGNYELTLKQPHRDGLLETNEDISQDMAESMFKSGSIMVETIRTLMLEMNINPSQLQYFGSLTTYRAEKAYRDGLMVLDHSFYLNKEDFELEYEVSHREKGQEIFSELLLNLQIPIRQTDNKIKRFYIEKYNQQSRF